MQFNIILFHIYFLVQIQLIKPSTGRRGKAKGTTRDDEAEKRNIEERENIWKGERLWLKVNNSRFNFCFRFQMRHIIYYIHHSHTPLTHRLLHLRLTTMN